MPEAVVPLGSCGPWRHTSLTNAFRRLLRYHQSAQTRTHMRGKTVVITGGTSGIGEVAAVALAKMGARIVLVARDKSRADATLARLRDSAPGIADSVHFSYLLLLAEMKRVAAEFAAHESLIDILSNNAGELLA